MTASLATAFQSLSHLDTTSKTISSSNTNNNNSASMSKLGSSGLPVTPTGSSGGPPLPSPALSMGSISGSNRSSNRHASLRFGGGDGSSGGGGSQRNTNRYSVTALYSMAAEQDTEIEDELARGGLCLFLWQGIRPCPFMPVARLAPRRWPPFSANAYTNEQHLRPDSIMLTARLNAISQPRNAYAN